MNTAPPRRALVKRPARRRIARNQRRLRLATSQGDGFEWSGWCAFLQAASLTDAAVARQPMQGAASTRQPEKRWWWHDLMPLFVLVLLSRLSLLSLHGPCDQSPRRRGQRRRYEHPGAKPGVRSQPGQSVITIGTGQEDKGMRM